MRKRNKGKYRYKRKHKYINGVKEIHKTVITGLKGPLGEPMAMGFSLGIIKRV